MYCGKCGCLNSDEDEYCIKCGNRLKKDIAKDTVLKEHEISQNNNISKDRPAIKNAITKEEYKKRFKNAFSFIYAVCFLASAFLLICLVSLGELCSRMFDINGQYPYGLLLQKLYVIIILAVVILVLAIGFLSKKLRKISENLSEGIYTGIIDVEIIKRIILDAEKTKFSVKDKIGSKLLLSYNGKPSFSLSLDDDGRVFFDHETKGFLSPLFCYELIREKQLALDILAKKITSDDKINPNSRYKKLNCFAYLLPEILVIIVLIVFVPIKISMLNAIDIIKHTVYPYKEYTYEQIINDFMDRNAQFYFAYKDFPQQIYVTHYNTVIKDNKNYDVSFQFETNTADKSAKLNVFHINDLSFESNDINALTNILFDVDLAESYSEEVDSNDLVAKDGDYKPETLTFGISTPEAVSFKQKCENINGVTTQYMIDNMLDLLMNDVKFACKIKGVVNERTTSRWYYAEYYDSTGNYTNGVLLSTADYITYDESKVYTVYGSYMGTPEGVQLDGIDNSSTIVVDVSYIDDKDVLKGELSQTMGTTNGYNTDRTTEKTDSDSVPYYNVDGVAPEYIPDYIYQIAGEYYGSDNEDSRIDVCIFSDGTNKPCGYIETYDILLDNNGHHDMTYAGYDSENGYEVFYLNENPDIQLMFGYQSTPAASVPVYCGEDYMYDREGGYYYLILRVNESHTESFIQTKAWES